MRILYFSRGYTPHDRRFLSALGQSEHEAMYLRLERGHFAEDPRPLPAGIEELDWNGGSWRKKSQRDPQSVVRLIRILNEIQPDIVHAGPVQQVAFKVALAGYKPLVTMSWGSDLLLDARRGLGRWLARLTLIRTAVLLCDCNAVRMAARQLGFSDDLIIQFPWGVDLESFSTDEQSQLRGRLGWEGKFVLISTRAWEPAYGIETLIEGFIQAAKEVPELRMMMLGEGSLRENIHGMLTEANLLDRVYFPGFIGREELPEHYRSADLYVAASRSDGSSVSLLEAMASGLPVLVSDIPGNREWVEVDRNGWLFERGSAYSFTESLMQAYHAGDRMVELGRRGRSIAEARADWARNAPLIFEAYELASASRGA